MSRTIAEVASETRILAGRIGRMIVGETLTYEQLSALIGTDVRGRATAGHLRSARRIALREYGVATECVHGEGIRRLGADNLHSVGDSALSRARRAAKRAASTMLTAAPKLEMDSDSTRAVNARVSLLSMIAESGKPKVLSAAEEMVRKHNNTELSIAQTFALFTKS